MLTSKQRAQLRGLAANEPTIMQVGKSGITDTLIATVSDALGGAPGIYSARYGANHDDAASNAYLLQNMQGITDRSAAFVCTVACVFPDGSEPLVVEGRVEGEILTAPRGTAGFGYDPLFYYPAMQKTMAEMSSDEKNSISHSGAAVRLFARAFADRIGERE